jgi:hypothetical protein
MHFCVSACWSTDPIEIKESKNFCKLYIYIRVLYSWKSLSNINTQKFFLLQASILVESGSSATDITSNGHRKNGIFPEAGYTNAAFVGSDSSLGVIASAATRPKPTR